MGIEISSKKICWNLPKSMTTNWQIDQVSFINKRTDIERQVDQSANFKIGFWQIFVDFCGLLWIWADFGRFLWIFVDFCGFLWILADFCGFELIVIYFGKFMWICMYFHSFKWHHLPTIYFSILWEQEWRRWRFYSLGPLCKLRQRRSRAGSNVIKLFTAVIYECLWVLDLVWPFQPSLMFAGKARCFNLW